MNKFLLLSLFWIHNLFAPGLANAQTGYYENEFGLFSTRPSETSSLQTIKRFGPVGIGIDLIQPAFTMRIAKHGFEGITRPSSYRSAKLVIEFLK